MDIRSWSKDDLMYKTSQLLTIQVLLLNSYMTVRTGFCSTPAEYAKSRKESKVALDNVQAGTSPHCFLGVGRNRCKEYEETEVTWLIFSEFISYYEMGIISPEKKT